MTPEAQRIAIAEACGFYVHREGTLAYISRDPKPNWDHRVFQSCPMPDYLNDLNAMHEAEKVLTEKHELFYLIRLTEVMKQDATIGWRIERTYHATASQRAEAFLRCLGKWPD